MSIEERLSEIERRLAELEAVAPPRRAWTPPPVTAGAAPVFEPPVRPARNDVPPPPPPPPEEGLFSEKWMGQRGLLAAGVILVLLAAGYLLKLAFDRGWISPALRCAGGVFAGLIAAGIGARVLKRGLRNYGASLIGLGFGIIYLSLWAASRLYQLVPPGFDIAALTFVSLALAAVAYILDIEALCVAAAAGAFLAPLVISSNRNPDGFIIYLTLIGATLGGAAAAKRWRYATFIVALSVFGLGLAAASMGATPPRILLLALLGGSAGLYVGLRERWPEIRFLAFSGGWGLLTFADQVHPSALVTVGGILLAAPVWSRALKSTTIWPDPAGEGEGLGGWSGAEGFYFYLTPICLQWAATFLAPVWFRGHPAGTALLVGIAYAVVGLSAVRIPFALVAAAMWTAAADLQWNGPEAVWALAGMSLAWVVIDRALGRSDGRWYALAIGLVGVLHLLLADLPRRPFQSQAFSDTWALALWVCIATAIILASTAWRPTAAPPEPSDSPRPGTLRSSWIAARRTWPAVIASVLWSVAGALLLFGVTGELIRFFRQSSFAPATAHLAGGLSVSAWWTLFAAGLVVLGFAQQKKQARIAGLAVAALAIAKVLLFDLSALDALYRVASVFILGMVSLLLAYLYHRYEQIKT